MSPSLRLDGWGAYDGGVNDAGLLRSIDPSTGEVIEEFPLMDEATVGARLEAAVRAQATWRETPTEERAAAVARLAEVLRRHRELLATSITREMGKPITEARAEVDKCAFCCDYYAEHAPHFLADTPAPSDSPWSFVGFAPLGVVLAVMPWNFPLWQVVRAAVPALCAGNAVVLKHAATVTRCALEMEAATREAELPDGLFAALVVDAEAALRLVADPRIRGVTLTGSDTTGSRLAAAAGGQVKKSVLELGGSDAFIVLEDADVAAAAETGARSRFQNCGQSCIAAKRFLVVEAVAEEFEERLVAHASALRVGDPRVDTTQMGPLARDDLRTTLERQLAETLAAGAVVRCGGTRLDRPGWFFAPTVVTGCHPETAAFREETFGPLAAVMRVADEAEAVAVANASRYGLGGNVWTADVARGVRLARRLETGQVFVNGMTHSDPRLPFGGVKRSGYGRELAEWGIREFCNVQTIWVPANTPGAVPAAVPTE